jgi:Zn-dependent protease
MDNATLLQQLLIWIIPLLFAITLHEVAHGWVAFMLGDPTAKMLGRLTINPIKHIDLIGTILVPIVAIMASGFIFGWAKPVPVTNENFKHRYRDMAMVAIAGPLANLLMAIGWAICIKLSIVMSGGNANTTGLPLALIYMGQAGVLVNISLFILNLLPIPPLDGGSVLSYLLPRRWSWYFSKIEPYGFIILLLLLVTGVLLNVLGPLVLWLRQVLFMLIGIQ